MERMEEDEQKEILLRSDCIEYFIERKQKMHQNKFRVLEKPQKKKKKKCIFFSLMIWL